MDKRTGNIQTFLHAAGKVLAKRFCILVQAHQLEEIGDILFLCLLCWLDHLYHVIIKLAHKCERDKKVV